jgi:hypothetical protein
VRGPIRESHLLEEDLLSKRAVYCPFRMESSTPAHSLSPSQEPIPQQPVQPAPHMQRNWVTGLRWLFSFPGALISLLVGMVYGMARNGFSDPDIWWHLRDAEYLLTHHSLIRSDFYSFTVAGHPWVNTEWLAEIPYYLAWRGFGIMGAKILSLVLIEGVFLGLVYLCWKECGNIKSAVLASCFAVLLGAVTFGPRTVLFGYIYLIILLVLLERFRSRGNAPLWVIPPLFCLWVNTHGSWSLGLIVFGIAIASGLIEGSWGKITATRWSRPQLRRLLITFLASVAVLFINPYGYRLVFYPFDMAFHQKLNISHVAEWVSVDFHDPRGKVAFILIVALLLTALVRKRQWKLYELGFVLFGLYCGLTYIRFLMLAAILISPLLAKGLDFLPPYRRQIDKPVLNAVIMLGILALMIKGAPSVTQLQKSVEKDYPVEALPYLKSHPFQGRVLNFYLWGGYLGWEDDTFKCFIDSRVDIFEYAGVLKDYIDLLGLKQSQEVLDKYKIQYVLFPQDETLTFVLSRDPRWKEIYKGKVSVLFERTGQSGPVGNGREVITNP